MRANGETHGSVSGCDFLEQVPPKVAATMKATLIAVAKAPPVRFCQPRTVVRRPSEAGTFTRRLAVAGVFGAFFCLTFASVSAFASEVGRGARVIFVPMARATSAWLRPWVRRASSRALMIRSIAASLRSAAGGRVVRASPSIRHRR